MSKINNPHDKFIHSYLQYGNSAREFFEYNLPVDIRDMLDLSTLKSENT
ncbi:MAG: transposase, partial [Alteromonadaceae bacterium]